MASYLPQEFKVLWPTEMLSSRRLTSQNIHQTTEVFFYDAERGLCPQLLGNEEKYIRPSVEKLEAWGAKAIDINMGCPVRQALQHNYGVSLMGDADYAARVVEMTVNAASVPVSVKLRSGMQRDLDFLLKFAKGLERAGAAWITLHPRTADQKRRGHADWNQVRWLKENLGIPVIGNGDVQTIEDAKEFMAKSGCDRVMVGRALLARPWILRDFFKGKEEQLSAVSEALEYRRFLESILQRLREKYAESLGLRKLRFLLYHSSVWLEFGHSLYAKIKNSESYDVAQRSIEEFFESPKRMFQRTELRH